MVDLEWVGGSVARDRDAEGGAQPAHAVIAETTKPLDEYTDRDTLHRVEVGGGP